MALTRTALLAPIVRWASNRRFPVLLAFTVALAAVNVFVPDPIPFVDEALLALAALLIGRLRNRDAREPDSAGPPPDGGQPDGRD